MTAGCNSRETVGSDCSSKVCAPVGLAIRHWINRERVCLAGWHCWSKRYFSGIAGCIAHARCRAETEFRQTLLWGYHHKTSVFLIIRHPQGHPTWVSAASIFFFGALLKLPFVRHLQVLPAQTLGNRCATRTLPQEAKVRARSSTR